MNLLKDVWKRLHTPEEGAMKGAMVPIGWAAYNGMWMGVLAGFGTHNAEIVWLYFAAGAIISGFGMAIYVSKLRHPIDPVRHRLPLRSDAGLVGALGIAFIGIGVIFGAWWYPFATIFVVEAIWLAAKDFVNLRHRKVHSPVQ